MEEYNKSLILAKERIAKIKRDERHEKIGDRIPPGQTVTDRFPILDLGVRPDFDREKYRLRVYGLLWKEREFSYDEILKMPKTELAADFHCVTSWSRLLVKWKGVLWKDFVKIAKPKEDWKFCIFEGLDGYTTNVGRGDLNRENVLLAYEVDGKPITREHGWPLRIIIPHLYGWKGSKFLKAIKFTDKDEPGFWEVRGYHNRGGVFEEERYS